MKIITILFFGFCSLLSFNASAQFPTINPKIYGTSPFQDSLWGLDSTNFSVFFRTAPSLPGFTITGCNGLAYDPTTFQTYVIMKVSGVSGRVLGTIDLSTGVCTQIGNLGDNFSSITFDDNGQLYGATGDGASVPESLYNIDKTNGSKTLRFAMGNGADGEILLYNRADDMIYHWSGNGTVVMEKFPVGAVTYTPTNIPISGTAGGETFGAMYVKPDYFLNSTISSNFVRLTNTGTYFGQVGSNPDDLRGTVMPPMFVQSEDTICYGETVYIAAASLQLYDSAVYHWGDGTTSVLGTVGGSHTYTAAGDYTIHIELDNGFMRDTITSFEMHVEALPIVTISGNNALCPGATNVITTSGTGSLQWYFNGAPISGETTTSLSLSQAGIYNQMETSLAGCSDSSATSFVVMDVMNPTVDLGGDMTVCGSVVLDAGNAATYLWSTGATTQTETVLSSTMIDVTITDTNGCTNADTISVTVNPLPTFSLGADPSDCISVDLSVPIPGAYLWNDGSTTATVTVNNSGIVWVEVTDGNGCTNADTVNVTIFGLPTVSLNTSDPAPCVNHGSVTLTGSPAGGSYSGTSVTGSSFDPSVGAGSYTISYDYTDGNGCSNSATSVIDVDDCASIEENTAAALVMYPNPSSSNVTVVLPTQANEIQIHTLSGELVFQATITTDGEYTFSTENFSAGMYVVTLTSPNVSVSTARLAVMH